MEKERILALRDNVNLKFGRIIEIADGVTIGDLFDSYVAVTERLKTILESHPNDSESAITGYVRLQEEVADVAADTPPPSISIHMDGGLIQEINDIPPGIRIEVFDYDLSDAGHPNVIVKEGKRVFHNIWTSTGKSK